MSLELLYATNVQEVVDGRQKVAGAAGNGQNGPEVKQLGALARFEMQQSR
eukprot:CAMPEP_0198732122 /NCGR_PEP_ID=MMETSP1475-20131203/33978_1 /TAXON_ID= ORGANISM="Unidentified sp., Strain CCMP1999" /NCGR_SAMPLE_ID=MMETSP1475 /ASSEMBLY_ACC=CAM_ASM_001111 /LENGTH=49 /DNA_ID=CAMNT_0044495173 /DNA_START=318 /DNA_END=467 /DNA_ORIENTATION=-